MILYLYLGGQCFCFWIFCCKHQRCIEKTLQFLVIRRQCLDLGFDLLEGNNNFALKANFQAYIPSKMANKNVGEKVCE